MSLTLDSSAGITLPDGLKLPPDNSRSMVQLNTANGYGSTNTMIRRFTNVITNQGSDITYADSATNGASFTINTSGVYTISYCDSFSAANGVVGASLNSAQLTTSIGAITIANRLAMAVQPAANIETCVSWTGYIASGSVIRAHTDGSAVGTNQSLFTITRVS